MFAGPSPARAFRLFAAMLSLAVGATAYAAQGTGSGDDARAEAGRRMYMDGVLPSGETMTGIIQGDIALSGEQVICGWCHRRSGLGSSEGQEVTPAVTGDILYNPLRLPTSKPPLAPTQRPAYTDETLKRAIRDGIGPDGKPFEPLMPRYPLSDQQLDVLIAYLKTLTTDADPGVDERDIHFATVVSDGVEAEKRDAFLKVFEQFFEQKNVETRHESFRAEHAPWHKAWVFKPYRKWVLHVWRLEGPPESWPDQLRAKYEEQPVFALISGLVAGPWRPVHDFCETTSLPCLFPHTDLPVVQEKDFYSVYLSRGMELEADAVARHIADEGLLSAPLVQVYRQDEPRGRAAAARFRQALEERGAGVTDLVATPGAVLGDELWRAVLDQAAGGAVVAWLSGPDIGALWTEAGAGRPARIYLSTSLYGVDAGPIPLDKRASVFLVHPYELPSSLPRLLMRSTGWLRAKRIHVPEASREQANAFFALKMAGAALKQMRGFFVREYLLETLEHMTENASYTSVYSRIALAPGQRFVSRGAYITQFEQSGEGELVAVGDWMIPAAD